MLPTLSWEHLSLLVAEEAAAAAARYWQMIPCFAIQQKDPPVRTEAGVVPERPEKPLLEALAVAVVAADTLDPTDDAVAAEAA